MQHLHRDYIHNECVEKGLFIQIGAGAGDLDVRAKCRDGFTEFIKKLPRDRIKKIILVEPNPTNIPLLRECWKDYPEAIIHEIAVVPKNIETEYIDFYYCPDDGPHYQVASIDEHHVRKHYPTGTIEKKSVPTITLEQFMKNNVGDETIDLLALDIEGIDADIVLDLDLENMKLKYLSFERLHLGSKGSQAVEHLKNNNFTYLGIGIDHNGFDYLYGKQA